MTSEDEYLERIVAGIHAVSSIDADVRWNEVINGRQFDVVVRFRLGTLDYLVVVEVKNRSRRASASDVEAFVTKARDQQASKAVFVTVAGFQTGAVTVAQRHGVDLFTVAFDEEDIELSAQTNFVVHQARAAPDGVTPELNIGEPELTAVIEDARLVFADGRQFDLPNETSQMNYYARKTRLGDGRSLGDLMQSEPKAPPSVGKSRPETIRLTEPVEIEPPDAYYFPAGTLTRIEMTVAGRMARLLSGNVGIEPSAFRTPVLYTNVLTGEQTRYSLDQLPLNTVPVVPGGYYFQMHPLRYLYCGAIEGHLVRWHLIESFQHGQLIRSTFTQDRKYGAFYIPVTDKLILRRLEGRLADYLALSRERPQPAAALLRPGFRSPPRNPAKRRRGSKRPRN